MPLGTVNGETVIAGHAVAVRVAVAGAALFPALVCKPPAGIVLRNEPTAAAVTLTAMVQDPEAGIVLNVARVTVDPPTGAATAPPQVVVGLGTPATTTPLGKVSLNAAVRAMPDALGLFTVMVSLETPPTVILVGLNAFVTVGGRRAAAATHALMALLLSVTSAVRASALPLRLAPAARVMLVSARIFPVNELPASNVAELTTRHQTLQDELITLAGAPPVITRSLADLKIHVSLAAPLSVSVPPVK